MSTSVIEHAIPGFDHGVFDALPAPVIVVERTTTRVGAANRRAAELLVGEASAIDSLVGRPLDEFVTLSIVELKQELRIAASGGTLSLWLRSDPNREHRQSVRVTAHEHDGVAQWILLFDRANSSRAKFVALNERLNETNHRAQQLREANRDLTAAREDLSATNADLEHFAHIAAHDLREPCRRQLALIDLLLDTHKVSDPVRTELAAVGAQSQTMLKMIEGFRFLSNMAGPVVQRGIVDLPELARSVVNDCVPEELHEHIVVNIPPEIDGYETLLRVLLRNLVINAVRYGERPLDLELTAATTSGHHVYCLSNAWSGQQEDPTDLLQPFTRGDEQLAGSGLGLSICRSVIQRHRGKIWLDPAPGVFRVFFTLEQEPR